MIKKTISFFIEPLGLVLVFGLLGFYFLFKKSFNKAKIFSGFSLLLLLVFSYPPLSNFLLYPLEFQYPAYNNQHQNIAFIHVLGSGHHEDQLQPLSSQIRDASVKRTLEGVIIYHALKNPNIKMIFTGAKTTHNKLSNAQVNASLAQTLGINAKNIIIGNMPKDTQEEAQFARSVVGERPFILVSSALHLPRAMHLFQNLSLQPIAAPTDFLYRQTSLTSAPNIRSFQNSASAIHEYLGIIWAYFLQWI